MPTIEEAAKPFEEANFKAALSLFASGVTVITTHDEAGIAHGMTATAFCSLSLNPPLVMVAIARESRCHKHIVATGRFGVSILAESQADLSRHFGGKPMLAPRFTMLDDVPIIENAIVNLACHLEAPHSGGDHSIFVGRVTATLTDPGSPLIHFQGAYRQLIRQTDA